MRLSFAFTRFYIVSFVALGVLPTGPVTAQQNPPTTSTTSQSDESAKVELCRQQLDTCVRAAEAPESINSCTEQEARCIADAMKVSVPVGTSVATLTQCTANAADCSLLANTPAQLDNCARTLTACIGGVAGTQLTCNERWTQCVQDQPLLFPLCALELLGCTDP